MSSLGPSVHTDDRSWRDDAACRERPSAWFTDPADETEVTEALATCTNCPVRADCLTTALSHPAIGDTGILGGTTEQTRHRVRTGRLTVADARQARHRPTPARDPAPSPPRDRATEIRRLPVPELTVRRTGPSTYESADGHTSIFRIHGQPPWMLMIDDRAVARTDTLTEARRLAWATLHTTPVEALDQTHGARSRR